MTMTLEDVPVKLNELDLRAPREVFDAIDSAIRERDELRAQRDSAREMHAKRDDEAQFWRASAERAEAELAALKAKIEVAPVVACTKTLVHAGNTMQTEFLEYTHERMPGGCNSWAGKRVRLVVEE